MKANKANKAPKATLAAKALRIWRKVRAGARLTTAERGAMKLAYWEGMLPRDGDYSVAQWVEDGCPAL